MRTARSSQGGLRCSRRAARLAISASRVTHKRTAPQRPQCVASIASSRASRSLIMARWLAYSSSAQPPPSLTNVLLQVQVGRDRMDELSTVLLCSEKGIIRMARTFPTLLTMDPEDIVCRLLALKAELPRCNVAGMVHGQPVLFLSRPSDEVVEQVSGNYGLISREMPQMDVDTVVQERPAVLFIDNQLLLRGMPELRSMTGSHPADSATCANLLWAVCGRSLEKKFDTMISSS